MIALYFDTETTGVKSYKDPDFKPALVQLGAILEDLQTGRVLAEINLIANQYPGKPIPAEASAIHGISDEMAATYGVDPKLIDITFGKLVKMADVVVAHNIDYDLDVIHDNMPLTWGVINDRQHFCTMDTNLYLVKAPLSDKQKAYYSSKGKKPDAPYKVPRLTETHMYYFGEEFEGAHDAMVDIRATRRVFLEMTDKLHHFTLQHDPELNRYTLQPSKHYTELITTAKETVKS
jgi:DNA polymerase-3 subunit epsilon